MKRSFIQPPSPETHPYVRLLAEQAFSRAAGAPLIPGNSVRLLKDAGENYPAWLDAMRSAKKSIHFESYIIYDDEIGEMFAEVMTAKAQQGVKVRLIYDWLGALGRLPAVSGKNSSMQAWTCAASIRPISATL